MINNSTTYEKYSDPAESKNYTDSREVNKSLDKTKRLFNPDPRLKDVKIHTTELPVLWSQLDANGHVNNGNYQFYLDEARMQALEEEGFSLPAMREASIGPVIQKAEILYAKPLSHPESVRIETTFCDFKGFRGKVKQTIFRKSDSEKVCEATFDALFFDFVRKRPWKLPQEFGAKYFIEK